MRYLIDTQILIWALISPKKLSEQVRKILLENIILVSQISLFEIAIKQKIGKLSEFDIPIDKIIDKITEDGFVILQLQNDHIVSYKEITLLDTHKDPFDRLLLATALSEQTPIISADENFKFYHQQLVIIEN